MDTIKRAAIVAIACAVWAGLAILSSLDPADGAADSRPCVTSSEWDRVDVGMSRHDVRAVLDGDGNRGPSVGVRWYRICGKAPRRIRAIVWYRDGGRTMDGGFWVEVDGGAFA